MNSSFDWRDMLRFDKMIAPTFLTILYYIVAGGVILTGLKLVFEGMNSPYYGSAMMMGGLAVLIIGPFIVRLNFELLIVLFKIHTRLTNIDYSLRGHVPPTAPPVSANPSPASPTPFGQPGGPILTPYQTHEPAGRPQPAPQVIEPILTQPIGFQVPGPGPTDTPAASAGQPLPDFWSSSTPLSAEIAPAANPVPPVDLGALVKKTPNWPAVLASLIALYAIVSPYAVLRYDGPSVPGLGQLMGLSYSIKNGSLGVVAVLATLVMGVTSAGGLKWLWFVVGYGVALLGSVVAFMEESSLFAQLANVRSGMAAAGSSLGQFVPGADQFAGQMAQQVPGASQFLGPGFYLFIGSMAFLGYWTLGGKYQEKGLMTGSAVH